ncbi:hypothetical protein ACPCTO_16575 [Streptomyces olivoreticuli]
MRRKTAVVIGALAASVVVTGAYALADVTLNIASGSGECAISWTTPGVTFHAQIPPKDTTKPGAAFTGGTGQFSINADPATVINNPVALAAAIDISAQGIGGFTLSNAQGKVVDVSAPAARFPVGGATFLVKSPAHAEGTRIPVFAYSAPAKLEPTLTLAPLRATAHYAGLEVNISPEFAQILNESFGPATAKSGDAFGVCSGDVTTS